MKESLNFIYRNFGVPKSIQSDNGKEFVNELLHTFHQNLNIRVVHVRPKNPRAQGQVERANQTIKRSLAKTLANTTVKRWIEHHDEDVYMYNITKHRASNKPPFVLFHGHQGFNTSMAPFLILI